MSTPRRVCKHGRRRLGPRDRATACSMRCRREESGQAMVEFALVLPLLMLILLAIIKFGIAINNYVVLTNSVRTGARTLAIGRGSTDPCGTAKTRVEKSASDLDPAKLNPTVSFARASSCTDPDGAGPLVPPLIAGDDVTLTVTYPCDLVILGMDFAFGSCALSSKTTERIE